MLRIVLTVLMLGAFGIIMTGCHASGSIGTDAASIQTPR